MCINVCYVCCYLHKYGGGHISSRTLAMDNRIINLLKQMMKPMHEECLGKCISRKLEVEMEGPWPDSFWPDESVKPSLECLVYFGFAELYKLATMC